MRIYGNLQVRCLIFQGLHENLVLDSMVCHFDRDRTHSPSLRFRPQILPMLSAGIYGPIDLLHVHACVNFHCVQATQKILRLQGLPSYELEV